jgi:hypothetical protein
MHPIQPMVEEVVISVQFPVNPTLPLEGNAPFTHVIRISSTAPSEQERILISPITLVTHNFGRHDDVLIMVHSGSSLELSPEKSYFLLFPKISFLKKVRRLLV